MNTKYLFVVVLFLSSTHASSMYSVVFPSPQVLHEPSVSSSVDEHPLMGILFIPILPKIGFGAY